MSMFPRFTQEISPLFRLLDDYDRVSRSAFREMPQSIRTFAPKFVPTEDNPADLLTKPLTKPKVEHFRSEMGLVLND